MAILLDEHKIESECENCGEEVIIPLERGKSPVEFICPFCQYTNKLNSESLNELLKFADENVSIDLDDEVEH